MKARLAFSSWLLPAYVFACIILGGASAGGTIANGLLQLVASIIIAAVGLRREFLLGDILPPGVHRTLSAFLIAVAALIAVPLIPLPAFLWAALPGREIVIDGLAAVGNEPGWRPLAYEPSRHIASALGFLPPLAILLLALGAGEKALNRAILAVIVGVLLSIMVGALQLSQGPSSALYFYEITSSSAAVGFFANSNHFATLFLVAAILALGAIGASAPGAGRRRSDRVSTGRTAFWAALAAGFMLTLLINRSLAGLGLAIVVVLYAGLIALSLSGHVLRQRVVLASIVSALGGAIATVIYAPASVIENFAQTTSLQARMAMSGNTLSAIADTFPFGVGLGNFRWLYPRYQGFDTAAASYVNHAHNDWAEWILETGLLGLIALGALIACLVAAARAMRAEDRARPQVWAPWCAVTLIVAHSLVDYPMRTSAITAIAALLFVFMLRGLTVNPALALRTR